jgi:hypothetical protein
VLQMAQLSKSPAHAFICRRVTRCASSTSAASIRASYQPLSHNAVARAWSFPIRFASDSSVPIDTPKARSSV